MITYTVISADGVFVQVNSMPPAASLAMQPHDFHRLIDPGAGVTTAGRAAVMPSSVIVCEPSAHADADSVSVADTPSRASLLFSSVV